MGILKRLLNLATILILISPFINGKYTAGLILEFYRNWNVLGTSQENILIEILLVYGTFTAIILVINYSLFKKLTMWNKGDEMPKRWFDLLCSVVFALFIINTSHKIYDIGVLPDLSMGLTLNKELMVEYLAFIIITLALRRFFYNKKNDNN